MKNRRSVGAEPYAPKKIKAITRGGKGRTTPVTPVCMSRSWKGEVCKKKQITRRDDQSAISSNKEHVKYEATQTYICQLRTKTRPLALDRQTTTPTESGTTATTKHAVLLSTYHHLRVAQLNNRRRNLYNTTLEAPGTQPLAMLLYGFSWRRSNCNHYYLLLV